MESALAISFRPLSLSDKELVEEYFSLRSPSLCDYSFTSLYLWRRFYATEICELEISKTKFLLIRIKTFGQKKVAYLEPVFNVPFYEFENFSALKTLISLLIANSFPEPLQFHHLSLEFKKMVQAYTPDFYFYANRNYANYVYKTERLSLLSGKKLQPKRNHVHQFLAEENDFSVQSLSASDKECALALLDTWEDERLLKEKQKDAFALAERAMIEEAFDKFNALHLEGIKLYVNGIFTAFTFGSALNKNTFCTHVEKATLKTQNAYAYINYAFAGTLKDRFTFINREEDMGKSGLRKAKMSYYPQDLRDSYFALPKHSDEYAIMQLWKEAFGDDDSFIASYMLPYSTPNTRVLHYEYKELLAMVHVHLCETAVGTIGYIYALAVKKSARKKGLGTQILQLALKRLKERGARLVYALQGNLDYHAWESCLGFFKVNSADDFEIFTPDGFCFGPYAMTEILLCKVLDESFTGDVPLKLTLLQ